MVSHLGIHRLPILSAVVESAPAVFQPNKYHQGSEAENIRRDKNTTSLLKRCTFQPLQKKEEEEKVYSRLTPDDDDHEDREEKIRTQESQ